LFQQATISGVENSVFCPCAVLVIMLAKEFELVQSAQTKSLCQQEKKPVDLPLLFCNDGLHTIALMAQGTIKESRDHPVLWSTIVQRMLVLHEVSVQLCKHFLQAHFDCCHPIAPFALNFSSDAADSEVQNPLKAVILGPVLC
jgi:hypothetical protein